MLTNRDGQAIRSSLKSLQSLFNVMFNFIYIACGMGVPPVQSGARCLPHQKSKLVAVELHTA
ncbi:MAG: hypothetical protein HC865_06690 [Cyanobacteria bacterium RU_5_0]|nr:hypothetical protein [Cyanobacteria bacterium RU_5_0]